MAKEEVLWNKAGVRRVVGDGDRIVYLSFKPHFSRLAGWSCATCREADACWFIAAGAEFGCRIVGLAADRQIWKPEVQVKRWVVCWSK